MDFTGVAIGSGVNQYMKMDEMARQNKKLEMEKALADQQMERGSMELDRLRQADAAGKTRKAVLEAFDSGDWTNPALQSLHKNYNGNVGSLNDGYTADHVGFDKSGAPMFAYKNADGAVTATRALTRADVLNAANNQYFDSISTPELLMQQRRLDQEDRKNDVLMAHYGRPTFMQDGTGRIIAIDSQGNQIGTYGSARPQSGGGSGSMGQLLGPTADRSGLIYNTPQGIVTRPLPQGVSADDLFPKATGVKGPTNPEDNKEWRKEKVALGPRPTATAGWFGGTSNQKALDSWDSQNAHIDKVYGVAPGGSATPAIPSRKDDPIAASKKTAEPEVSAAQPVQPNRGLPNPRSRLPQNMRGTADPNGVYPSYTYSDLNPR